VTKHSPTPWRVIRFGIGGPCIVEGSDDGFRFIASPTSRNTDPAVERQQQDVDAAHIVKCVNHHDELVAALGDLVDDYRAICRAAGWQPDGRKYDNARALLAKLKETP